MLDSSAGCGAFTITDSQSNSYSQTVCASTPAAQSLTNQIFTGFASATGSLTWTIAYPGTVSYFGTFSGYTSVASIIGAQLSSSTTSAASGSASLTTTAFKGLMLGRFQFQNDSAVALTSNGNTRQNYRSANSGAMRYSAGSNDIAGTRVTWNWTSASCTTMCYTDIVSVNLVSATVNKCANTGYVCFNSQVVNGNIQMSPNATFPAIALSNSSIDLSTGAAKALAFSFLLSLGTVVAGNEYGYYLTLNGTLPNAAKYSPTNDTSVSLAVIVNIPDASHFHYFVYMNRNIGSKLFAGTEDPSIPCTQAYSLFLCATNSSGTGGSPSAFPLVLNYTGGANGSTNPGQSYLCKDFGSGGTSCSVGGVNNQQVTYNAVNLSLNYTQPWLNLQNSYHLGFWEKANSPSVIGFATSNNAVQNSVISVFSPSGSGNIVEGGFFGWVGRALGGAWNAAGGVLASIPGVSSLLGIGNSLLAAFISALIQAGNLLIGGLSVLESLLVTALNAVGNFAGLGPIGTNIQTVINSFITFFTNGAFSGVLGYIGNVFTVMFNRVTVALAWVAFALTTILNVATWLVNGVAEVVTISTKVTLVVAGLFAVLLMLLWFMDLGDYGASGGLVWLNTAEWLVLGTGIRFVTIIINFGIDIISGLISLVPKPFVQMHNIPGWMRVPGVETSAQPTFPDGHMQAIRDLNIFAISGWLVGFVFFIWFESTNLPGTIGAAVAGAQPNLTPLSTLLPVYYILLLLLGVSFLAFLPATLTNAIPQIFGDRQGKKETGFSFRAEAPRVSGGFGLRLSRRTAGVGRFQRRVERKRMEARERRSPAEKPSAEGVG